MTPEQKIHTYDEIKIVHLELTAKCNAACPMCGRNWYGGPDIRTLPKGELGLDDIKKILPSNFIKQLNHLYICGNHGDPLMAKDTLEILTYIRNINPRMSLGMHSNASGRSKEWWAKLGKLLSHEHDYCRFSIDGLEDTNHLYRRNTNWKKIMESSESFIANGGKAIWEYLIFKHNQHQLVQAKELA